MHPRTRQGGPQVTRSDGRSVERDAGDLRLRAAGSGVDETGRVGPEELDERGQRQRFNPVWTWNRHERRPYPPLVPRSRIRSGSSMSGSPGGTVRTLGVRLSSGVGGTFCFCRAYVMMSLKTGPATAPP